MGKIEEKIMEEIAGLESNHRSAVDRLAESMKQTRVLQIAMEQYERELAVKHHELEVVRYGVGVPDYFVTQADTFHSFLVREMEGTRCEVGQVYKKDLNTLSFKMTDVSPGVGRRDMGTVEVTCSRNAMGEPMFNMVYHRIDSTKRVRTYRDFQMTSGVFEETLDVRRAIHKAIQHLLGEPRE